MTALELCFPTLTEDKTPLRWHRQLGPEQTREGNTGPREGLLQTARAPSSGSQLYVNITWESPALHRPRETSYCSMSSEQHLETLEVPEGKVGNSLFCVAHLAILQGETVAIFIPLIKSIVHLLL